MCDITDTGRSIATKTVIVGAGVAGISTAVNLFNENYNDFLILDALDRIGGRCYSLEYGTSFIEIGAQFIHGQVDNPIYEVARDFKQIDEKYNEILFDSEDSNLEDNNGVPIDLEKDENLDGDDSSYIFVTQHGKRIDLKVAYEIYNDVNKAVRLAKDYCLEKTDLVEDRSVGDFVREEFFDFARKKYVNQLTDAENTEFKRLLEGFLLWRCKCENIEIGCHSMCDLSLKNYCVFQDQKGCQIMQTNYGYSNIIKYMIEEHKENFFSRLRLQHALRKILLCNRSDSKEKCTHCSYTDDPSKVVLLVKQKDELKDLVILCDNVVCTMSLGYLKANLEELIEPKSNLVVEKVKSVSRLGFGTINKIFLVYESPFWSQRLNGIQAIWVPEEGEAIMDRLNNFNEKNWFESICYFEPTKDQSNILCAWMSGCEFVEKFDDDRIARDCTMLLKKLLQRDDIPMPKSVIRSTWNSDPFFRGSYSFLPLGSLPIDLEKIAEPILVDGRPTVMFAGEATSYRSFSTTHGAYFSGKRESNRILKKNLE